MPWRCPWGRSDPGWPEPDEPWAHFCGNRGTYGTKNRLTLKRNPAKGGQTVNHEYYEELISARLDGLLTEEEERELDEHLASCPDCRRARREMDTVHRMLLAASPMPPEGLEDRILDDLPNQPRRRSPWMKKAAPWWSRRTSFPWETGSRS